MFPYLDILRDIYGEQSLAQKEEVLKETRGVEKRVLRHFLQKVIFKCSLVSHLKSLDFR